MPRVYTKIGDFGCTMIKDEMVEKDSLVINAQGAIDELQSSLDMVRLYAPNSYVSMIEKIQDKLRYLAGELAGYITDESMLVREEDIDYLEEAIDEMADVIPKKFVRFNSPASIHLNEARVRTRALERHLVKLLREEKIREVIYRYINGLSDFFFVLSYKLEFSIEDFTQYGN